MSDRLLRSALVANAGFSALSGAVLVVASVPLAEVLEVPAWLLIVIGAGLIPFALGVLRTARTPEPSDVRAIIAADVGWVVVAIGVVILAGSAMATTAVVALCVVTVIVADFALLQYVGLRRASSTP